MALPSHYNVAVMLKVIIICILLLKVNIANASDAISIDSYLNFLEDSIFANVIDAEVSSHTPSYVAKKVNSYIGFFATDGREVFQQWLDHAGPYLPHIREILREEGVPEDLALLPLIESGFNVNARSPKKAMGLWQFMASTGALYGLKVNKWVDERKDPIKSTRAAARHLRDLHNEFGTWPLALASYNAGSGKVRRALATTGASTFWEMGQSRALKAETRNYVPKFMAALIIAKNPDAFGFILPEDPAIEYDVIELPGGMDLRTVSKLANINYSSLRGLNPGLKGYVTPFGEPYYVLRLPEGAGATLLENFDKLSPSEKMVYREHRIRQGDTVYEIAKRYGTNVSLIQQINNLNKRYKIVPGDSILVPSNLPSDEGYVRLMTSSNVQPDT